MIDVKQGYNTYKSASATAINPSASTQYWVAPFGLTNAEIFAQHKVRHSGVIIAADLVTLVAGTFSSSENVIVSIFKNAMSAENISSTVKFDTVFEEHNNNGMAVSVTDGDDISVGVLTPAWVTLPTTVLLNVNFTVRTP